MAPLRLAPVLTAKLTRSSKVRQSDSNKIFPSQRDLISIPFQLLIVMCFRSQPRRQRKRKLSVRLLFLDRIAAGGLRKRHRIRLVGRFLGLVQQALGKLDGEPPAGRAQVLVSVGQATAFARRLLQSG